MIAETFSASKPIYEARKLTNLVEESPDTFVRTQLVNKERHSKKHHKRRDQNPTTELIGTTSDNKERATETPKPVEQMSD